MPEVIMYTSASCGYCVRAKALLTSKNIPFTEIRIDQDTSKREEMITKSGRQTVPQIFINGDPIGGFDDLYALETSGELDKRLQDK